MLLISLRQIKLRHFTHSPVSIWSCGRTLNWMRTTAMCLSLLQFPRCHIYSLANSWLESFHKLGRGSGGSSSYRVLCSIHNEPEGGHKRRWTRRTLTSKAEGSNEKLINKTSKVETTKVQRSRKLGVRNKVVSGNTSTKLNTYEVEKGLESEEYYIELAKFMTVLCFDLETTGFRRDKDRIIEIACQDLQGGENSTFQTLVNPERDVPNEEIHGISTRMVNRPGVPRMADAVPIFLQYVQSRQMPGGFVLLVSHNGRAFDVPFLKNEFSRCNYEIPDNWRFVDTDPLGRAVFKAKGIKVASRVSLQALREHYSIPLIGQAHRALSDVHTLALVLQRLTYDLKLPKSGLIKGSFK